MPKESSQPVVDPADADVAAQLRQAFKSFRPNTDRASELLPPDILVAADPPAADIPAKVFVGPNATWYDDRWRWMDWRGRSYSWNWAAATTLGGWFAYRRMYGLTMLCLAWAGLLVGLAYWGVPLRLLLPAELIVALLMGVYGNALYLHRFRRVARAVGTRHQDHVAQLAAAERAGGTDWWAALGMALALPALVPLAFWAGPLLGHPPGFTW